MVKQQEPTRSKQTSQPRRSNRLKRFAVLVGALATSVFFSCSSKTDIRNNKDAITAPSSLISKPNEKAVKMRCYDYGNGELKLYTEDDTKQNGQLGSEKKIHFSELDIENGKNNSEPLAYFCTHAGYLFWVTSDIVYIRRITIQEDKFLVSRVLDAKHTEPDEYAVPGVKVISADISKNPDEDWERIMVATLTKTGLFQVSRFSQKARVTDEPERAIYDFMNDNKLDIDNRWPEKNVSGGVVRILDNERFSVIPIGERGKGNVRNFYYVIFDGKQGESFRGRNLSVFTMKPWKRNPGLKNIFEISKPVRYDKRLGGWVVNLTGEKRNGNLLSLFPIITPEEKD